MARIFYIAKNKDGKKVQGSEDNTSVDELVSRLQAKNLIVVKIFSEEQLGSSSWRSKAPSFLGKLSLFDKIKTSDLTLFCRQLAVLLAAGVTIIKSVEIISQQVKKDSFLKVLRDLKVSMERGLSFHEALAKHRKVFNELWINLVHSGEASGNLAVVLDRLARFLERNEEYKRKVTSALIYPAILLIVGMGALFFLTIKIIPTFGELFAGFDIELPLLTLLLLKFSYFLRKFALVVLAAMVIFGYLLKKYIQTENGRRQAEIVGFKIPMYNEFARGLILERFSAEMSTLVESGVPILYALEITEQSVDSKIVGEYIHQIKEDVRQGKSLKEGMARFEFFDPMIVQMVSIGEEIGELPQMLKRVHDFYQEYVETFLVRFTLIFEPVILIFMGLVIGLMIGGIFLPIFKISQIAG
ncbi:MAG: type II secretion system F family protein [Candidatus Omnitrophota bacterium]|nr:type II secretion system F family protein [Candidatus Omnitrophota bacterium]